MLTKPQAIALAKWRDGEVGNVIGYRVREDVADRLRRNGYLCVPGFLMRKITDKGLEALAEYEKKHGPVPK